MNTKIDGVETIGALRSNCWAEPVFVNMTRPHKEYCKRTFRDSYPTRRAKNQKSGDRVTLTLVPNIFQMDNTPQNCDALYLWRMISWSYTKCADLRPKSHIWGTTHIVSWRIVT